MFLIAFRHQGSWYLHGSIISCCIVSRINRILINISYLSSFSNFWIKFKMLFKLLKNFCHVSSVWIFMSQWKYFSLLQPVEIFLNLLLFPKFLNTFLPFSEFNNHYWPTKFWSLGNGILDKTFETKKGFGLFSAKLPFFILPSSVFFLYDLVTNKARKLEVAE